MRMSRAKFLVVALVLAAGALSGLQFVHRAAAEEPGLLEKRESLYNNIFIFGDRDQVTMTFGQNKRYYTESSMKLSDPGGLTVDYTRYMTLGVAYPPQGVERIAEIGLGLRLRSYVFDRYKTKKKDGEDAVVISELPDPETKEGAS